MESDKEEIPMETVGEYFARPLPALNFNGRGDSPDPPSEKIAAELLHPWIPFENDITTALQGIDLSREGPQPSVLGTVEYVGIANKVGLFGRFVNNVCDPVARALNGTDLQHVRFGGITCIGYKDPLLPGVSIFLNGPSATDVHVLAVGVFQPFWNYPLEAYPVMSPLEIRRNLEHKIGQLVSVTRAHSLKYGFFYTYRYTVFFRCTAIDHFELSLPIHEEASNPSVRECMAGFCAIIASDSGKFEEPSNFNEQMLLSPST